MYAALRYFVMYVKQNLAIQKNCREEKSKHLMHNKLN